MFPPTYRNDVNDVHTGMNVIGVNPSSEIGARFTRSTWGWHPLWTYCEDRHADVVAGVQFAYSNEGDGLDASHAMALAYRLRSDLVTGVVDSYVTARTLVISALPDVDCLLCLGAGVRTDDVGVDLGMPTMRLTPDVAAMLGRTHGWCNGCSGHGLQLAWEKAYTLRVDDVIEFADFLVDCGGFQIW